MNTPYRLPALLLCAVLLFCGCGRQSLIQAQFEAETELSAKDSSSSESESGSSNDVSAAAAMASTEQSSAPGDAASEASEAQENTTDADSIPSPEELLAALSQLQDCTGYHALEALILTGKLNDTPVSMNRIESSDYAYTPMGTLPVYQSELEITSVIGESCVTASRSARFDDGKLDYSFSDGTTASEKMTKTSLKKLLLANLTAFSSKELLDYYSDFTVEEVSEGYLLRFTADSLVSFSLLNMGYGNLDSSAALSEQMEEWSGNAGFGTMLFERDSLQLLTLTLDSNPQSVALSNGSVLTAQVTYTLELSKMEMGG